MALWKHKLTAAGWLVWRFVCSSVIRRCLIALPLVVCRVPCCVAVGNDSSKTRQHRSRPLTPNADILYCLQTRTSPDSPRNWEAVRVSRQSRCIPTVAKHLHPRAVAGIPCRRTFLADSVRVSTREPYSHSGLYHIAPPPYPLPQTRLPLLFLEPAPVALAA
jgi:hypothetical protein